MFNKDVFSFAYKELIGRRQQTQSTLVKSGVFTFFLNAESEARIKEQTTNIGEFLMISQNTKTDSYSPTELSPWKNRCCACPFLHQRSRCGELHRSLWLLVLTHRKTQTFSHNYRKKRTILF
ncbi:hypothetical protein ILYODFUR_021628 [Ilyodon furcidens]|uniref:Uncharacterized protein n=1 Tax=Ilyodon furcidens TaxID=33524 RepID=A0ABV0VIK8_9TELE